MILYAKRNRPGGYPYEVIGVTPLGVVSHLVHGCFLTLTDGLSTAASIDVEIEKGILYPLPDSYTLLGDVPKFAGWRRSGALYVGPVGANRSGDRSAAGLLTTVSLSAYSLSEEWWITQSAVYDRKNRTFSELSTTQWSSRVAAEKFVAKIIERGLVLVREGPIGVVLDPRAEIDVWYACSEDKKRDAAVAAQAAADAERARKVREILGRAPGDLSIEEFASRMRMRRSRGTT